MSEGVVDLFYDGIVVWLSVFVSLFAFFVLQAQTAEERKDEERMRASYYCQDWVPDAVDRYLSELANNEFKEVETCVPFYALEENT